MMTGGVGREMRGWFVAKKGGEREREDVRG